MLKKIIKTAVPAMLALAVTVSSFAEVSVMAYYKDTNGTSNDNGDGTYTNPVMNTDVADPDVICAPGPDDKEAYYMVSTAMQYSPGCPIMKSTDMVNWETVNYLYDSLDYDNDALSMRNGQQAYGNGQWATSIRYNEKTGMFFILTFSYTTGTTQVYTSYDVENGPWKKSEFRVFHDPSIFIDTDGRIYVYYGQNSLYCKELIEEDGYLYLKEEENDPDNAGVNVIPDMGDFEVPDTIYEDAEPPAEFYLKGEGTHAYKIDGEYYLISITWPSGKVWPDRDEYWKRGETCFRSIPDENGEHHPYGPFEGMLVMNQTADYDGYIGGGGVGQGGITNAIGGSNRSSKGNWYGIIFQDRGALGRCPLLVNVDWNTPGYEGWPMMSAAETGTIPDDSGEKSEIKSLTKSDEFNNGDKINYAPIVTAEPEIELTEARSAEPAVISAVYAYQDENGHEQRIDIGSVTNDGSGWSELTGRFTTGSTLTYGRIEISGGDPGVDFYLDDASLRDLEENEHLQNGEMSGNDGESPWWWGPTSVWDNAAGGNVDTSSIVTDLSEFHSAAPSMYVYGRESEQAGAMQYINGDGDNTIAPETEYDFSVWVKAVPPEPSEPDPDSGYVENGEYIINGSMEDVYEGHPSYWDAHGNAVVTADETEFTDGTIGLKVSGRASAEDGVMQYVSADFKAGKEYRLTFNVKTDEADTVKAVLLSNYSTEIPIVSGSTAAGEWTELSSVFTAPDDFDGGYIKFITENTDADFYMDEASMPMLTDLGTQLIVNGGFETEIAPWVPRYNNGTGLELRAEAAEGSGSLYVTGRTQTGDGPMYDVTGKIDRQREYKVRAMVRYDEGPDTKTFNLTMEHVNDNGDMGWYVLGSVEAVRGEWCEITGTAVIDDSIGVKENRLYFETTYNSPADPENDLMDFYVDAVSVVELPAEEWVSREEGEHEYNGSNLDLMWQWNHNPDNRYWSLTEREGYLRLKTGSVVENIQQARNTLTQRTFGPECSGWISMDTANMKNGDYAGLAALQSKYGFIGVKKYGGKRYIVYVHTDSQPADRDEMMNVVPDEQIIAELEQDVVYLKSEYTFDGTVSGDTVTFYYSTDEVNWTKAATLGDLEYSMLHFTGYKFALFNFATNSVGGYVDFDYFRVDDKLSGRGGEIETDAKLGEVTDGILTVNAEITDPYYRGMTVYAAAYDESGRLIALDSAETDGSTECTFGLNIGDAENYSVKLYAWDGMEPLAEATQAREAGTVTPAEFMENVRSALSENEAPGITEERQGTDYGTLQKYTYYSETAKRDTNVNVLLPPGYDENREYPVLYMLHGYWGNEDSLLDAGDPSLKLRQILGNLIEDGEAEEMIVVFPYIFCSEDKPYCTALDLENTLCYDNFINDLTTSLMPFIEENFSVKTGRENTAITGFSQGGREALFIGITRSDLFGYVGGVCPAPGLTPGADLSQHPGQLEESELKIDKSKGEPYLLMVSAAVNDSVVGDAPYNYHDILTRNGEDHVWHTVTNGDHGGNSIRPHFYNFVKAIFKAE